MVKIKITLETHIDIFFKRIVSAEGIKNKIIKYKLKRKKIKLKIIFRIIF